jgi:hypothetical protein
VLFKALLYPKRCLSYQRPADAVTLLSEVSSASQYALPRSRQPARSNKTELLDRNRRSFTMQAIIGPTLLSSKEAQPTHKPFEIYDTRLPGFTLRVQRYDGNWRSRLTPSRYFWPQRRLRVPTSYLLRAPYPRRRGPSIRHSRLQTFLRQRRCDPSGCRIVRTLSPNPARGTAKAFTLRFRTSPNCPAT